MTTTICEDTTTDISQLKAITEESIEIFRLNRVCQKVDSNEFTIADYHKVLCMIFHQVNEGPSSFALAGVNCPTRQRVAKDYLLKHADEEKTHWEWIVSDLANTGYIGENVLATVAQSACLKYVALNYYAATKVPVARLAIAAVLEGIGANYGA